jgi:prepilin-type N-terminal cleavage/methylation domain-containing protein
LQRKLPFTKAHTRKGKGSIGSGGQSARGFSLLELVVVVVIIAFLMVLALDRLVAVRVDAERAAMEAVVGTLKSAIGIKFAEAIVKRDNPGLRALEGSNPMERLAEVPKNYLGELDDPEVGSLEPGNWYFDRRNRVLVYLPEHVTYFAGGVSNPPRARFAIKLIYADKNNNGVWDVGAESVEGVRLAILESYQWTKTSN